MTVIPPDARHRKDRVQFAVSLYQVKFREWKACVAGGGCNGYVPIFGGHIEIQPIQPVVNVSWHDANAYVEWLSRKTGQSYRLMSNAELDLASYDGWRELLDNKNWEWMEDCWSKDLKRGATNSVVQISDGCSRRIIRGGDPTITWPALVCGEYCGLPAEHRDNTVGFRVARELQ